MSASSSRVVGSGPRDRRVDDRGRSAPGPHGRRSQARPPGFGLRNKPMSRPSRQSDYDDQVDVLPGREHPGASRSLPAHRYLQPPALASLRRRLRVQYQGEPRRLQARRLTSRKGLRQTPDRRPLSTDRSILWRSASACSVQGNPQPIFDTTSAMSGSARSLVTNGETPCRMASDCSWVPSAKRSWDFLADLQPDLAQGKQNGKGLVKFLIANTDYSQFLSKLYARQPGFSEQSFKATPNSLRQPLRRRRTSIAEICTRSDTRPWMST